MGFPSQVFHGAIRGLDTAAFVFSVKQLGSQSIETVNLCVKTSDLKPIVPFALCNYTKVFENFATGTFLT